LAISFYSKFEVQHRPPPNAFSTTHASHKYDEATSHVWCRALLLWCDHEATGHLSGMARSI